MNYEYIYQNNQLLSHHEVVIPSLLRLIDVHVQTLAEKNKKLRILDLGSGNGSLSNFLTQKGYDVVGVEESTSGIEMACKNFLDCQFIQGSNYDLPHHKLGEKFDLIISIEVIEHLFYPKELLRSAKRYLKPGGRLILSTPYHGYLKNIALSVSGKMDKHFTCLWDGGHIKFFSVATLKELLESEKYEDIQFTFAGRFPYLWKAMLCSSTPIYE